MLTRHRFSPIKSNQDETIITYHCDTKINQFEQLPTELFYILFKYFWAHEILHSFLNLNHRFDLILKSYSTYQINFQSISKSDFHFICEQIHPEQVISLILSDNNDTVGQSELFLSYFQIEQFRNLRSLSLLNIEFESLFLILPNLYKLKQLHSFSFDSSSARGKFIKSKPEWTTLENQLYSSLPNFYNGLLPQLKYLSTGSIKSWPLISLPNLHRLRFNLDSVTNMNTLFQNVPRLESITFVLSDFLTDLRIFNGIQPYNALRELACINQDTKISLDQIEQFLQSFPNLIHFEIKDLHGNHDMDIADGYRWQMITQSFSTFNFLFNFKDNITEQIFDSFRTLFWIQEKRWFVIYSNRCLRTISISDVDLPEFSIHDQSSIYPTIPTNKIVYEYKTTSIKKLRLFWKKPLKSLTSSINLNQIEYLTISLSTSHILKDIQHVMPRLHTLQITISGDRESSFYLFENIQHIQMKQIHTLIFDAFGSSVPNVYDIRRFSDSFPFVKHLSRWHIKSRSDIIYCINKFKQLSNISFEINESVRKKWTDEFDLDLIIDEIKQFINYSSVTCRIKYLRYENYIPADIHLWFGERLSNKVTSIHRRSIVDYLRTQFFTSSETSTKVLIGWIILHLISYPLYKAFFSCNCPLHDSISLIPRLIFNYIIAHYCIHHFFLSKTPYFF